MGSLEVIANRVNAALPYHDRAIIRPEEIDATRTASCFGRAALVGAALLQSGRPEDSVSMLISETHGAQSRSGNPLYGHAELVLDSTDESALILTARSVRVVSMDLSDWTPGLRPEEQGVVTAFNTSKGLSSAGISRSEVMAFLSGIVEADEQKLAANKRYRAFPLREGIEFYQQTHADLREKPIVTLDDYLALYNRLVSSG